MLSNDYIIGLVDGEGSFTVQIRSINKNKKTQRRAIVEPKFYIKLSEKDKAILFELKSYFNCGNVYFQKDNRPNHSDCYRFEVSNRVSLNEIIIPFFMKNNLKFRSKINDFKIFCKIMELIRNNAHFSESGLNKIRSLKSKMH